MYTASDEDLMNAIFEIGDSKDHLIYGLLNAIDDPEKPTKSGGVRKLPKIAATIYHRDRPVLLADLHPRRLCAAVLHWVCRIKPSGEPYGLLHERV
jgi:hypothetical protein